MVLSGKTALVTGASQGVGKGIALALAQAGCNVVVNYFCDRAAGVNTVNELKEFGVAAIAVEGDVRRSLDVNCMFDIAETELGNIDILVNNAGIQTWGPLLDVTEEDWDRVIETNLKGCFLCTQVAGRRMRDRTGGVIINIGSGASKVPFANLASYTASKGAIEMFTRVAAIELGPHKVRVNCVAPGAIEIERTKLEAAGYSESWAKITPLRRIGMPMDVGKAVLFLASDDADFITGQTLWVDGAAFSQPRWPSEGYVAE
jgi:NAD(P)-dependent dehydrogenase (short-subunit alcohol dehydrogenase family)